MSYEMKDILKTMIDNNEPYWSSDTMDMVRVEIHNVYAQAAKADEYEAKAKAFDEIVEERNQAGTDMYGKDDDVVDSVIESAFWNIDGIIVEYERGGYDE